MIINAFNEYAVRAVKGEKYIEDEIIKKYDLEEAQYDFEGYTQLVRQLCEGDECEGVTAGLSIYLNYVADNLDKDFSEVDDLIVLGAMKRFNIKGEFKDVMNVFEQAVGVVFETIIG